MKRLCDEDCNTCPLMFRRNTRHLTMILNALYERLGNEVYQIVETYCPNLTVCADCHIDDFCHVKGCKIMATLDENETAAEPKYDEKNKDMNKL